MHGKLMKLTILVVVASGLWSCTDSINRAQRSLSNSNSLSSDDLNILSSCVCKSGLVVDGEKEECSARCITNGSSSQVSTFLKIQIGKNVSNKFAQLKGYNPTLPISSICKLSKHSCQAHLEETVYEDDGEEIIENIQERDILISGSAIREDDSSYAYIFVPGLKPVLTKASFRILKETNVFEQSAEISLNIYNGDGVLNPINLKNLTQYACIQAHLVKGQAGPEVAQTFEYFHFAGSIRPQYFYINPLPGATNYTAWPFLCHQSDTAWSATTLPTLLNVELPTDNPVKNRMHETPTNINFWNAYGSDAADFQEFLNGMHPELSYDIDKRIFDDYQKKYATTNGSWVDAPLFAEFLAPYRPREDVSNNQIVYEIPARGDSSFGYYLEPQPLGISTLRSSYRCPDKISLESAASGRIASIAKVLKSATGKVEFYTRPFFAACAEGKNLIDVSGNPIKTAPRVIYLSVDSIKNLKPAWLSYSDEKIVTSINSSTIFTISKTHPQYVESITFKIVRPSVVTQGAITTCNIPSSSSEGYVYGCYPVKNN